MHTCLQSALISISGPGLAVAATALLPARELLATLKLEITASAAFGPRPHLSRCARPADAGCCLVRVAGKIGSASGDKGRPSGCNILSQVLSQHLWLVKHTVPLFADHLIFCLGNTTVITRAPSATQSKARRSFVVGHGSVFQARRWISWSH